MIIVYDHRLWSSSMIIIHHIWLQLLHGHPIFDAFATRCFWRIYIYIYIYAAIYLFKWERCHEKTGDGRTEFEDLLCIRNLCFEDLFLHKWGFLRKCNKMIYNGMWFFDKRRMDWWGAKWKKIVFAYKISVFWKMTISVLGKYWNSLYEESWLWYDRFEKITAEIRTNICPITWVCQNNWSIW
jgi:hypothetical protein